ncbi:MAG: DUF4136 domain-containing protein [Flavobacteriaceae bacterium]
MRKFLLAGLLMFVISCASVQVNYDYDPATDFSDYRTYNYFSDLDTGLSNLDNQRLLDAVDSVMQIKGIKLSEEPEFLINIQSQSYLKPQNSSLGVGVGGTGSNVGGGVSIGVPLGGNSLERELVFDFVDNQKNQLFWQAVTLSNLNEKASPHIRERKINEIVSKVFAKYPPAPKKP